MSDDQEDNTQYLYRSVRTTCTLAAENIAARRYVRLEQTRGRGSSQSERDREEGRQGGVESRSVGTRVTLREEHFSRPGLSIARGQCPIEDGLVLASSMHRS